MIATALSATLVVLGVVIVVRTITAGVGGGLGLLLGALFVVAGAGRLYVQHRRG